MAESFSNNEIRSSIRAKLNRNASELSTATQTIITINNEVTDLKERVIALETGDTSGTGSGSTDGTLTTESFRYVDVFNYSYQDTGSSGQMFSKDNTVQGYKGTGYALTNSVSGVSGTCAIAYINGFAPDSTDPKVQVDRKVWIRVRGATGATIAGKSHNSGALGTATLTTAQSWHWIQLSTYHKAYDNQYQLHGRSSNVLIDGFILTTLGNNAIPSGASGFRNS